MYESEEEGDERLKKKKINTNFMYHRFIICRVRGCLDRIYFAETKN